MKRRIIYPDLQLWREGMDAFKRGDSRKSNPYHVNTDERYGWLHGWINGYYHWRMCLKIARRNGDYLSWPPQVQRR